MSKNELPIFVFDAFCRYFTFNSFLEANIREDNKLINKDNKF